MNFILIIGTGCTTAFIRVFAAIDLATDLQTVTPEAIKMGLTKAADTGEPIIGCIRDACATEMERLPVDHYLRPDKHK